MLQRDGQHVSLEPVVGLAEEFVTVRHVPDPDGGRVLAVPHPLVWPQEVRRGRRVLQTFAGLEPLLVDWLKRRGHEVELTGDRPPTWPAPDSGRLADFDGSLDGHLLDFVRHRERGLVRHGPAVDPARLVAQVARGWRRARVLVMATRRRDAKDFRDRLLAFLSGVYLFAGTAPSMAGRVTVATAGYARAGAIGIESRTVLVALDPEELFPAGDLASPVDALRQARRARLYGIMPVGHELPPYTRSLVTALFGTDEVVVPRHGHVARRIDVAFVRVEGGPRVHDDDPVRLMRSGVWQHPVRNRRLARLAGLVAAGRSAEVREQLPHLTDVHLRRHGGRVVLLAANVEHALALAGYLSDAPISCGTDLCRAGLKPEQKLMLKRSGCVDDAKLVIATPVGLPTIGEIEVLVRADAGRGLPPIPDDQLVVPHGTKTRLLVVDTADRHHPALRTAAGNRKAAYRAAGWSIVCEPELSPLDRFLADRPEVKV